MIKENGVTKDMYDEYVKDQNITIRKEKGRYFDYCFGDKLSNRYGAYDLSVSRTKYDHLEHIYYGNLLSKDDRAKGHRKQSIQVGSSVLYDKDRQHIQS